MKVVEFPFKCLAYISQNSMRVSGFFFASWERQEGHEAKWINNLSDFTRGDVSVAHPELRNNQPEEKTERTPAGWATLAPGVATDNKTTLIYSPDFKVANDVLHL